MNPADVLMDVQMPEEVGPSAAAAASMQERIRQKLSIAFSPVALTVINESDQHAGHAGSPGTGESHFKVVIVSPAFEGKSRLERHRLVHAILTEELRSIHALALSVRGVNETG